MGYEKPKDYVEVKDRIPEFFAKFPNGSLTGSYELVTVNGKEAFIYTARAYRSPEDPHPGIGTAYEPVPGATPYTKGSELQNAETAAWGRAMIATGAVNASAGVASADEVRSRQVADAEKKDSALASWQAAIDERKGDREALVALYSEAAKQKAGKAVLEMITAAGKAAA